MALGKLCLHLVVAAAGAISALRLLHELDSIPFWSWGRSKICEIVAHGDEYDVVFAGSSRIHNGFVPADFDSRMAELGVRTHSFNFGLSGLQGHDVVPRIDWLLAHRSPSLRVLVVELQSWDQRPWVDDWMTDQAVESRVVSDLGERLRSIWLDDQSVMEKLHLVGTTMAHTLVNVLRIGQGPRILDTLIANAIGVAPPGTWPVEDAGFRPAGTGRTQEGDSPFRADPARAAEMLVVKERVEQSGNLHACFNLHAFLAMHNRITAAGIVPVYVRMPMHGVDTISGRVKEIAAEFPVIDFGVPKEQPELFVHALWDDPGHFNSAGARLFSRLLAERMRNLPAFASAHLPRSPIAENPTSRLEVHVGGDPLAVQMEATGLPSNGDVLAAIGRREATRLPNGLELGLAMPPYAVVAMRRSADGKAAAQIAAKDVPRGVPLFAQYCVILGPNVIAMSNVVELAPIR